LTAEIFSYLLCFETKFESNVPSQLPIPWSAKVNTLRTPSQPALDYKLLLNTNQKAEFSEKTSLKNVFDRGL
jgi:hypothetical protein